MAFPAENSGVPGIGVKFTQDRVAVDIIHKIADRAVKLDGFRRTKTDKLDITMDVSAVHANGCPLDLDKLLAADDFNFAHDLYGIYRHLDRETGQLTDFFTPRCAAKSHADVRTMGAHEAAETFGTDEADEQQAIDDECARAQE